VLVTISAFSFDWMWRRRSVAHRSEWNVQLSRATQRDTPLRPRDQHVALQAARARQTTAPAWQKVIPIGAATTFLLDDQLDDLGSVQLPRVSYRRAVLVACAAIFCVPIAWLIAAGTLSVHELGSGLDVAWGFAHPPLPPPGVVAEQTATGAIVRDSALLIWLPLAGIPLALIARRLFGGQRRHTGAFVTLMVSVLVADLFRANMGFNPAIRESSTAPPLTGAIRYLQTQQPNRFVGVSTGAISQPLPTDYAMRFGLYDARAYDFPVEKHLDALWRRAPVASGWILDFTQPEQYANSTPAALRALDLLSVSDLVVGPLQAFRLNLQRQGLRVAYSGKDAVVYANDKASLFEKLPGAVRILVQQVNVLDLLAAGGLALAAALTGVFVIVWDRSLRWLGWQRSGKPRGLYRRYAHEVRKATDLTPLRNGTPVRRPFRS